MFNCCEVLVKMEECYEYFSCTKTECPAYGKKDVNCWEAEETLCHHPLIEYFQEKLSEVGKKKCDGCAYYMTARKGGA